MKLSQSAAICAECAAAMVPYLACMIATAHVYRLPPRVLPSIQAVEGGAPGVIHVNTDHTQDLGVMQINTRWVWPIAGYVHWQPGQVYQRLTHDACFNIAAAGLILRTYLNEAHGDLLRAVGDYHSHTLVLNLTYRAKVVAKAAALFGG